MHEQITQTFMSFLNAVLRHPDAFAVSLKSVDRNFADLSDGQKTVFFATMFGLFKHFELMYVQHANGIMDQETWDAWSEHIRMYVHQPGAQTWWNLRKAAFIPGFRAYLDSSAPPEMKSFVDVMNS